LFDSHCHLDFAEFDAARDEHLAAARRAGVTDWFVPGCAPEQWPSVGALAAVPGVHCGYGIHPWWAEGVSDLDETLVALRRQLLESRAVALGECGLDGLRAAEVPMARQIEVFEAQLQLGRELGLPLVLHQVRAREDFLRALDRVGLSSPGAVVHGFAGDATWARALIGRGLFFGVGPALLRRGRERLRQAVTQIPLERLLVETDAPDQGLGGQRGVPLDLVAVVDALARLRGQDAAVVGSTTAENARGFLRVRPVAGA